MMVSLLGNVEFQYTTCSINFCNGLWEIPTGCPQSVRQSKMGRQCSFPQTSTIILLLTLTNMSCKIDKRIIVSVCRKKSILNAHMLFCCYCGNFQRTRSRYQFYYRRRINEKSILDKHTRNIHVIFRGKYSLGITGVCFSIFISLNGTIFYLHVLVY